MAMYICDICDELLDGDYSPCVEHPTNNTLFCCEACANEAEEDPQSDYAREVMNETIAKYRGK